MADDWERLAMMVRERRYDDLGMTQEQVAAAGGPSTATQRMIEGARQHRYHLSTLRRLEDALGWEHGSVRRVLAGGDPAPAPPAVTAHAGLAAAEATATAAATVTEPDALTRLGLEITGVYRGIQDEVWREILAARGAGTPETGIFTDRAEQGLWDLPSISEDDRALSIAALRSMRPRRSSNPGRAMAS